MTRGATLVCACALLLLAGGAVLAAEDFPNLGANATKIVPDEPRPVKMQAANQSRGGPIEVPRPIVVKPLGHDGKGGLMPIGTGGFTSGMTGAIAVGDSTGSRAVRQLIRRLG